MQETMSQVELADYLGVTQGMVSRYVAHGKIPASCLVQAGRRKRIVVDCAVQALEQNLSLIHRQAQRQRQDTGAMGEISDFSLPDITFDDIISKELSDALEDSLKALIDKRFSQ